jgi:hypothetical protein
MAASSWTFKEIQDLVQDQLQDVLAATDMTATKIKRYINLGYLDFVRRTRPLTDSYDVTTVADQASYSIIDADFSHVAHVRYIEDSDNEYGIPLRPYPGGFANLPKEKTTGVPYWYWVRYNQDNTASEIGTVPIAATASQTITVWGFDIPADLSADGDKPLIKKDYQEVLILWPVWKMCNAYAHKSKAIREKALTARSEYLELVGDAAREMSAVTLDEEAETVDVYGGYDGTF